MPVCQHGCTIAITNALDATDERTKNWNERNEKWTNKMATELREVKSTQEEMESGRDKSKNWNENHENRTKQIKNEIIPAVPDQLKMEIKRSKQIKKKITDRIYRVMEEQLMKRWNR